MTRFSEPTKQLVTRAFQAEHPRQITVRTTQELKTWGINPTLAHQLCTHKVLMKLARGVYVRTSQWKEWKPKTRCLATHYAATKIHPGYVLSHASAALWWQCPELGLPSQVHLSAATDVRSRQKFIRIHKNRPDALKNVRTVDGVQVTSPLQTALDCASTLPTLDALCIVDSFLHRGMCAPDELAQALDACEAPGRQRRRVIKELMSAAAESPAESITRFYLHLWKLPKPSEQLELIIRGKRYRPDFVWEDYRLILEVDGEVKYSGAFGDPQEVIRQELRRQRELERAGWKVIRVRWKELMNSPESLRADLLREFQRL